VSSSDEVRAPFLAATRSGAAADEEEGLVGGRFSARGEEKEKEEEEGEGEGEGDLGVSLRGDGVSTRGEGASNRALGALGVRLSVESEYAVSGTELADGRILLAGSSFAGEMLVCSETELPSSGGALGSEGWETPVAAVSAGSGSTVASGTAGIPASMAKSVTTARPA